MSGKPNRSLRVVSLLPSATEKLALIGGLDLLVGRSHECDYPASASNVPVLTSSRLTFESSKQIDEDVSKVLLATACTYACKIGIESMHVLKSILDVPHLRPSNAPSPSIICPVAIHQHRHVVVPTSWLQLSMNWPHRRPCRKARDFTTSTPPSLLSSGQM